MSEKLLINDISNHTNVLNEIHTNLINNTFNIKDIEAFINNEEMRVINNILKYSEKAKGVLSVLITSLTHKIINKNQDIRYHKNKLENGYSGRTIDTKFITPFLKENNFPHMAESGWLTRSLELDFPYNLEYPGQIKPDNLKQSFLKIIDNIEDKGKNPTFYLYYIFYKLIEDRNLKQVFLAKPTNLTTYHIRNILNKHFHHKYSTHGGARLPVLAIYAAYQCLLKELHKYKDKTLIALENHTASDLHTGKVGDIQINHNEKVYEAIEVKHGIKISSQIIFNAYEKFKVFPIKKYYFLTTSEIDDHIYNSDIVKVHKLHGCEIHIENVTEHIFNILKNIENPYDFIENYVNALMQDATIKYEHKSQWNNIIENIT